MTIATPKILVVDDNAATRMVYRDWIAAIGDVEVVEASGGQQALELARQHDFAMILLDIGMPDMDGFETASRLRQDVRSEQAPIVFISSELNRNQRVRGYRTGAVDCLVTEPMDPDIVVQKARVFLQLFRKRQELQDALDDARGANQGLHARLERFVHEQDEQRHKVTHDTLTGLPNRTLFNDRVASAISRAQRGRHSFALAQLILDGFKPVNDLHGHATGDALIRAVADRLSQSVRATDTLVRFGGDVFALLFEELDNSAAALHLAEKILHVVQPPLLLHSETQDRTVEVCIGVSMGLALYPEHAGTREDLMALAGQALQAAKRAGGGIRFCDAPTAPDPSAHTPGPAGRSVPRNKP